MGAGVENGRHRVRILIACSWAIRCRALNRLLQNRPDLVVVAEAADAQEMLVRAEATSPDVVILDSELSKGPREDLIASLRQLDCQPRVLVLGSFEERERYAQAGGADAFVSKSDALKSPLSSLYTVHLEERQ